MTQPDRPKGRGKELQFPPVKEAAVAHQIPVYQPERIRRPECIEELRKYQADVIVVVAFGQILPKDILELTPYGCINVHASLLPDYRGAAPIQWAILNGEKETGITIHYVSEVCDGGETILQVSTPLSPLDSVNDIAEKVHQLEKEYFPKTVLEILTQKK